MRNYFKSPGGYIVTFDDTDPVSIETAYSAVVLLGRPSVYRPVPIHGVWDTCTVIGSPQCEAS